LVVFVRVAENCKVPPALTVCVEAETVTTGAAGVETVMVPAADFVVSACAVAVARTVFGDGAVAGAV
jgi:hypothetical protein